MKIPKEAFKGISYAILIFTPILSFFAYAMAGPDHVVILLLQMLGAALFFYVLSFYAEPEKKEWVCQNCQATLIRKQIKFGLCPHCGVKVKGFRGLSHRTNIYDF